MGTSKAEVKARWAMYNAAVKEVDEMIAADRRVSDTPSSTSSVIALAVRALRDAGLVSSDPMVDTFVGDVIFHALKEAQS